MEAEEREGEMVVHELQLAPGEVMPEQDGEETVTINMEDATEIILQGEGEETSMQGAVQIAPGTYQILTQDTIQLSEELGEAVENSVTQIEVPLEVLQEAVEMLQGQDIEGDAVEAAIASIAARHMAAVRAKESNQTEDVAEIMDIAESDMDQCANGALNEKFIEAAVQDKSLPDTSELEALTADDSEAPEILHIAVSDSGTVTALSADNVSSVTTCSSDIFNIQGKISKPKEMVSLLQLQKHRSTETIPRLVGNVSQVSSIYESTTIKSVQQSELPSSNVPLTNNSADIILEHQKENETNSSFPSEDSNSQETLMSENSNSQIFPVTNSEPGENSISSLQSDRRGENKQSTPVDPPRINISARTEPPQPEQPTHQPDLSEPIVLQENMEVTVLKKRCILLPDPDTGQLCAYPLIPVGGKRKRGRPKKEIKKELVEDGEEKLEDKENWVTSGTGESQKDAVDSLLELSNTGPDGVRRSGRKRKKARTLKDYSILKGSSDEESLEESEDEFKMSDLDLSESDELNEDSEDEEYKPYKPAKKGKPIDYSNNPTLLLQSNKRRPGRPRRSPYPGQPANPAQIPAILVNGQTIMIQGLETLSQGKRPLAPLMPKPPQGSDGGTNGADQIIVINNTASTIEGMEANSGNVEGVAEEMTAIEIPTSVTQSSDGQATILQFSEDVVNMLTKKDPLKLGLKAPEGDLEKLKCGLCDFQAYYLQQYKDHLETHTDETHKCKCCQFVSLEEEDLFNHYKENHPRSICSVCNFTAEQPYVVKRHMSRHDEKGCTCHLCGKVYKDQYIMKMHIKHVHMPAAVLYECEVCEKKFTRKAHLKRHARIHDEIKPYKCPLCDYKGGEKSDVNKHMLIHEEPKYECEICGKTFRHVKNKEVHLKRHSGQKDYKCGICGTYGYTFTDIRKHIERKHCDIKSTAFICEKCGASFQDDQTLTEHHSQGCDPMAFEQALSITTTEGDSGQATIQIPASVLQADGQPITYDGQHLTIGGNQVNITVQHLDIGAEEESIMLTAEQLAGAQIDIKDGDTQVISAAQMVTELVEAGLAHVAQTTETQVPIEPIEQSVVISAAEDENSIILAKEDETSIILA